jgi:hypothetical protein
VTGAPARDQIGLFSSCLPGWNARRVIDVAAAGYQRGFSIDHLSAKPTRDRSRSETEPLRRLLERRNKSTQNGGASSPASA